MGVEMVKIFGIKIERLKNKWFQLWPIYWHEMDFCRGRMFIWGSNRWHFGKDLTVSYMKKAED
jgi:hypothetical protein